MNQIMYKGFEVAEHPCLPEGCGMMWTEKQTIIFKVNDGKFEFWEAPQWTLYSTKNIVEPLNPDTTIPNPCPRCGDFLNYTEYSKTYKCNITRCKTCDYNLEWVGR